MLFNSIVSIYLWGKNSPFLINAVAVVPICAADTPGTCTHPVGPLDAPFADAYRSGSQFHAR